MAFEESLILSHPTINANWRNLAMAVYEACWLKEFHTTLGWSSNDQWMNIFPRSIQKELARRSIQNIPSSKLRRHPWKEVSRLIARGCGLRSLVEHEKGRLSIDSVFRDLDYSVSRQLGKHSTTRGIVAGEDGALEIFRAAKKLNISCIYELPIAYFETAQRLAQEETQRLPAWAATFQGRRDSPLKLERKRVELSTANLILCPSSFVAESLPPLKENQRFAIVPYGCEAPIDSSQRTARPSNSPLKVLFVGSLTQRKGLADLFDAIRFIGSQYVELHLLGSPVVDQEFYRRVGPDFIYHAPCSKSEVIQTMLDCDILVLPSIIEGRALVQLEALSCGMPIIVTRNAGGDDLIDSGETGFIVPIRSPEAIASKIDWFLHNRDQLPAMRLACLRKASIVNWSGYKSQIRATIGSLLQEQTALGSLSESCR